MRRVVVTGLGLITPLGVGTRQSWASLLGGASGIVSTSHLYPTTRWAEIPSQVAGLVPTSLADSSTNQASEGKWQASDWLSKADERRMAKFAQYALAGAEMALADAGWRPETQEEKEMAGVCLGSGIGNLDDVVSTSIAYDKGGYKSTSPLFVPKLLINLAAGHISTKYGLQGPNHAVSTACTTGAHAIGDASRFIAFGDANVMLAGGAESCIHPLAFAGFSRSRSLATNFNDSPSESSRPFDDGRDGFVMGEGAGVLLLEEMEHAKARGAEIYAEIVGYGCSGDAYHMTAPREDGAGALLAMRKALKHAGVKPKEVGYINAHATSTALGDAAENHAMETLMLGNDGVQKASEVTVSSTKGAIGHLLGAAGAVEAIFSVLAIKENIVPPTANLYNPSPGFDFNYVPLHAQQRPVEVAISNSFGFGGTNATLVFAKMGYKP